MIALLFICGFLLLSGCNQSGPESARTDSSGFAAMQEKTTFLRRYVAFRRNYTTLDFNIFYQNNANDWVPGPSDWDIRLVATVPASELHLWIDSLPPNQQAEQQSEWLKSVPTPLDLSGVDEWYGGSRVSAGIDRDRNIVAWRTHSFDK